MSASDTIEWMLLERNAEEEADLDEGDQLEVSNETDDEVDKDNEKASKAEDKGGEDVEDSNEGNINLSANGKNKVQVDRNTNADGKLKANSD